MNLTTTTITIIIDLQDDTLVLIGGAPTFYTFTLRLTARLAAPRPLSQFACRAQLLRTLKPTTAAEQQQPRTCVVPDGLNGTLLSIVCVYVHRNLFEICTQKCSCRCVAVE
jgi:hypothetical protein